MKLFTMVCMAITCSLCFIIARPAMADRFDVIGTSETYTVVGFGHELFVGIDIVVLKDTSGAFLAVFTATEIDTNVSTATRDSIELTPGQKYQLTLYAIQLDSVPIPNIRTDWRNLEIGITTADTTFIVWRAGQLVLPSYMSKNIRSNYLFLTRKD